MLKHICVGYERKDNSNIDHVLKGNDPVFESILLNNQVAAPLTRCLALGWESFIYMQKYDCWDEWFGLAKADELFV